MTNADDEISPKNVIDATFQLFLIKTIIRLCIL